MGRANRQRQDQLDPATRTLGDLLFADQAKTPVSEKDWVGLVQTIAASDQRALHALYERSESCSP